MSINLLKLCESFLIFASLKDDLLYYIQLIFTGLSIYVAVNDGGIRSMLPPSKQK